MKHNTTFTVCIPAHNEEANIGNLLESVLRQKLRHGRLLKVLVLCDGCTDDTADIARKAVARNPLITVVDDGKRLGKHRRLLSAFLTCRSDIVLVIDGDTLLSHARVLDEMLAPFVDPRVSLVGGNNIPVPDKGFANYLINAWALFWFGIKHRIRGGVNVHNVRSCCLAMRMSLVRGLDWPKELQSHGQFLYLEALRVKTRFVFAHEATVWYRNPTTFADYAIQKKRGVGKWKDFKTRFGPWVQKEYSITPAEKFGAVARVFIRHPGISVVAILFRLYLSLYFKTKSDSGRNHFWTIAQTTKKGISMDLFASGTRFFTF